MSINWIVSFVLGYCFCIYKIYKLEDRVAQLERFIEYQATTHATTEAGS